MRPDLDKPMAAAALGREVQLREHPRARRVRIRVLPPGRIVVTVPPRFNRRLLPDLLKEHDAWLAQALSRFSEAEEVALPQGVRLSALEREWRVRHAVGGRPSLREVEGGWLEIDSPDAASARALLRRWLQLKGREHLLPWLHRVSEELELPYSKATVRSQRRRWGSCSARKAISLNCHLLFLPPPLVRYLFVHELCHTVELNHSERFWAQVAACEPDYRQLDRALRRATDSLPGWLWLD